MQRDNTANSLFVSETNRPTINLADELTHLRQRTLFAVLLYSIAGATVFGGLGFLLLWQFMLWVKGLPANVKPSWERMLADRPELLAISGASFVLGVALTVGGMWMWRRIFGAGRMPPRKLLYVIGSLPLGLVLFAIITTMAKGALAGALTAPFMLGGVFALLPFQIGFLAYGMLGFSVRQVRERPELIAEDQLPAKALAYFQEIAEEAAECKLELVGDYGYGPKSHKFRRYYIAPNGAYFVDSTYVSMGSVVLKATSVFSATSDGNYFESCDLANPAPGSEGNGPAHVQTFPNATLDELIEEHVQSVSDWTAQTGSRPMVFDAADVHALSKYGVTLHMRDAKSDFMWLGNPYANQPVPPLPGRAWENRENVLAE